MKRFIITIIIVLLVAVLFHILSTHVHKDRIKSRNDVTTNINK